MTTNHNYLPNSPDLPSLIREYSKLYNRSLSATDKNERQQITLALRACDALLRALSTQQNIITRQKLAQLEKTISEITAERDPK